MKGRTELFLHNSTAMALQQVIAMITALIIPRILLLAYGSEINGFIVSITQFISYFMLVEAGLSGASVYALYKPLANEDVPAITGILSAARKFYQTSGYVFLGLILLLAILYPVFASSLQLSACQVAIVVFSLSVPGILDFFILSKYQVLLVASQRSYVLAFAQMVYLLLNLGIIWVLVTTGFSIVTVQVAVVFAVFVRAWMLCYYTRKHFPYVNYTAEPEKNAIKDRWNVLYLQILNSVQNALPIILATLFTSLKEVSVYSVYNSVLNGIAGILGIFISGLAASFGDIIARKQRKILKEATQQFEQAYYMLITVVYGVALLLILPFVKLYTIHITDAEYILPWFGFICILNGLLYHLKTPQGMLVISAGMYRQTRWQSTTQALIAAIGGLAGAVFWGLYGIVGGLILSNIYRDIDLLFFIPKHLTKLSYKRSLRHILLVLFTFGIVSVFWFFYSPQILTIAQWLVYAVCVSCILIIWTVATNYFIDPLNMKKIYKSVQRVVSRRIE